MKQNIILIAILIALFFFGLLIYDFSDNLDSNIANNDWHTVYNGSVKVISFADYKFNYYDYETDTRLTDYKDCLDYRFNRSINVIRLNCPIKSNKLYITSSNEEELILRIDGEDITFYSTLERAINAEFIKENEISEEEFTTLMNFDINYFKNITTNELNELVKNKNSHEYIAFISREKTINNALNLAALINFSNALNQELSVIIVDDLPINNKVLDINLAEFNRNQIPIYIVGNKVFNLNLTIEINKYSDIDKYMNFESN